MRYRCLRQWMSGCLMIVALAACSNMSDPVHAISHGVHKDNKVAAGYNVQLSMAYLHEGDMERAKRKILLALEQAPDWPPALDGMAYYYAATKQPKRADHYYQRALEVAPRSGTAMNNYGTFLCQQKHYKKAIHYFLKAVAQPKYVQTAGAYENAGLCAAKIPDNIAARKYFQRSVSIEPKRTTSLYELAKINYQQKHVKIARRYLKRFVAAKGTQTAEVLRLSIQIEKHLGHLDKAASQALTLQAKFPHSKEAKWVKRTGLI